MANGVKKTDLSDSGHYVFRTLESEHLCYESLKLGSKNHRKKLLDNNIQLLKQHHPYIRDNLTRNRLERVMDYLEILKYDPNAVFDIHLPQRFRRRR